jgi:hypothetical protein
MEQCNLNYGLKYKFWHMMALGRIPFQVSYFRKKKIKHRNGNKCAVWMSPLIPQQCYLPADKLIMALQFQALGPNHVHF